MKTLNFLSNQSDFGLENGSGMTREWLGIDSTVSRKLFTLLFVLLLGFGQMWGAPITVNQVTTTSGTYTIACAQGTGQNAPADQGNFIRCYANNTITISTTGSNMTEIVIAWTKNSSKAFASVTASPGSYTHPSAAGNGTWTGNANSVTFTVGSSGQIQITTVTITEASSKTLSSISVQTAPTKKKYIAGETFDPTGLIITRNYSSGSPDTYTYASHTSEFTFSPTTSTALTTSNTSVSITYGGKSTSQAINVYNVTMQARDEDGNAIPSGGPVAPTRSGKSITPAADANNYVFKEWSISGASLGSSKTTKSNTITSPTGAVTVTAVYYKPITITYKANGQDFTTQTYGYGGTLAFPASEPDGDDYSCTGKTFTGWVAEANKDYSHATTAPTYATAGGSVTTGATYYAVFADASTGASSSKTYSLVLTGNNFVQSYNERSSSATANEVGGSETFSVSFSSTGVMKSSNSGNPIQFRKSGSGAGVLYNTTDLGTINSITYGSGSTNNIASTHKGSTQQPTSNGTGGYFKITNGSSVSYITSITINFTKTTGGGTTYTNFETTCCTPLVSINGSISWTNVSPTSVTVGVPSDYSDKDNANLEGYIFKRYAASTGGDALETIETNAANKTTATFNTGLVANTTYYYTIIAKHSSSSCNSAETSPRKSYKIDSYVVSYANGGGSGTNPGAHDPVLANGTVDLKSNTFDAPTGKEFKAWNDGTSDFDEGETYTVTANKTMTAQWACIEPGFTKNLSTAQVNYLQGQVAATLSITAAANGAELSYQWQKSPNGASSWENVGTNSNEYTPSTATAGDQYYHCIVTNLVDGCTDSKATSAVAHIHVDVPAACLQPVISVASGTYYEDKSVTITCGTDGASIYYTTDGSTTPTSGSTLYEGAITVDHSMTIKAIAIKAEMDNSTVAEATYTIKCVTPTIVLAAGNYTGVQTTTITKGYGTKIYYTTDGSTPSNTNGTEYTGAVSIDQPMTLKAIVWKDGCTNSEVASAAYTLNCTTPTFNYGTGTYTGAQSIMLSGTAEADIYYTTDGTTPSKTNGTKYTAAIEVSANQTVKAIAVKEGWGDSEIASATYTIQYNVYWWVNGADWNDKGGSTLVTYGQTATAPTTAPTKANGCGDKFMGWTETQNYENDNTAPVDMFTETSAAITGETNFYAVFADYGEE